MSIPNRVSFSVETQAFLTEVQGAGITCTVSGTSRETDLTSDTPDRYSISTMDYLINKKPISLEDEASVRELANRLINALVSKRNLQVVWIHFESKFVPMSPRIQIKYDVPTLDE